MRMQIKKIADFYFAKNYIIFPTAFYIGNEIKCNISNDDEEILLYRLNEYHSLSILALYSTSTLS